MMSPQADRGLRIASWLIRIAIVLHLAGLVAVVFNRGGTAIGNVALMDWDYPDSSIFTAERICVLVVFAIGASLLVYPTAAAAALVGVAVLAEVTAGWRAGGQHFIEWNHSSQAIRYLAPFALVALLAVPKRNPEAPWRFLTCAWLLRIGISIVFIAHGLQALAKHPQFIDLIIGSTRRWVGYRPSESQAVALLIPIGIMDVVVGLLLLAGRWRALLIEMAAWGLITALSRVTANGPLSYPEVLLRASHFLIPIAILQMAPVLDAIRLKAPQNEAGKEGPLAFPSTRQLGENCDG